MPKPDPATLPEWSAGTVAILSTFGEWPHSIPVSTGIRAGERHILIALAARRVSLANLRSNPRVSLTLICEGDVAVTANSIASVVADPMEISDRVCAVSLDVVRIRDHGQPRFAIETGVSWRWTDREAEERDIAVREELAEIARRLGMGDGETTG